ncbi:hypothetical protein G7009_01600 [Pseudomonas capeferrum]|uniref:hypothetical protein n=1 Tax=Pseudomonas capeferrum TaxID=1495066 RepID=UPI0015E38F3F|nr:hypothetical protein [Pseudomonas capeferrum]MBA1200498.1 hypothetical protein [Pseudomonas capeferrum]
MHPAMQQRVDGLAVLRERTILATADFYAKIGRPAPAPGPRFQAVTKGRMWHIIDRTTGKTCGFCGSYVAAQHFVQAMEAAAGRKLIGRQ